MPRPAPHRQTKTTPRKARARSGWSDERRVRHAAAMRTWKPWEKSTGPKTVAGRARSSRNAVKDDHHTRSARLVKRALREHSRYLADIHRYISLKKIARKNELLKRCAYNLQRRLKTQGRKATNLLLIAFCYEKIVGEGLHGAVSGSTSRAESSYKYSFKE